MKKPLKLASQFSTPRPPLSILTLKKTYKSPEKKNQFVYELKYKKVSWILKERNIS